MKTARDLLAVSEFVNYHPDDLAVKHIRTVRSRLPPLKVQPAEKLLFLCRELHKTHSVAAVTAVVTLVRAQRITHAARVHKDGTLRQRRLQLIHICKRKIYRLSGAAELFCNAARVDRREAAVTQHLHGSVDYLIL